MKRRYLVSVAFIVLGLNDPATAADVVVKKPVKVSAAPKLYDWTGPYVGFHVGYGGGSFGPNTNPLPLQGVFLAHTVTGLIGGYQVGYNLQTASGVVLGVEADVTFPSPVDFPALAPAPFNTTLNYVATARARLGYAVGDILPYATAGIAWGQSQLEINDANGDPVGRRSLDHLGWTAGIGLEHALTGNWTAKYEYNYIDLGARNYGFVQAATPHLEVDPKIHVAKFGLNYRLWNYSQPPSALIAKAPSKNGGPQSDDWSIHGQTTFLPQAYPSFRSPYEGPNSLPGKGQGRET